MSEPAFAGAVLAGGRSQRYGRDKCGVDMDGRPLVDHALDAVAAASERWIVGGPLREREGVRWLRDEPPGRGPLVGIRVGLRASTHAWLAVVACDMPFVPPALWPLLLRRREGALLVMPEGPTGLEPTAALYHRDLLPSIDARLAEGRASPRALLDPHGIVVGWDELSAALPAHAFHNVNRPEDLP